MLCSTGIGKKIAWGMMALGVVSIVFGVFVYLRTPEDQHNLQRLMGMFTGFGTGILAVGVFLNIRRRLTPPEKLREQEINQKDERNRQILLLASRVGAFAVGGYLVVSAFVLVGLGYPTPAYIAIGGLYLEALFMLGAARHYNKKL